MKSCLLDAEIKQQDRCYKPSSDKVAFSAPKLIGCFRCHKKRYKAADCKTKKLNYHGRSNHKGRFNGHQSHLT